MKLEATWNNLTEIEKNAQAFSSGLKQPQAASSELKTV